MRGDEAHKWQELKFTRIDGLKIFAQKTKKGMLVMLWKPFPVDTIRKCDLKIMSAEGQEIKPIISKKNFLILSPVDGELYSFDFKCEGLHGLLSDLVAVGLAALLADGDGLRLKVDGSRSRLQTAARRMPVWIRA